MNASVSLTRKKILWALNVFLVLNLVVSLLFWAALCITKECDIPTGFRIAYIHFIVRLIFAVPVYWLIFRKYRNKTLRTRLLLHLFTMPLFIALATESSYFILSFPAMGSMSHLKWPILFWDYFNVMFIYFFLFSGIHIYENYIHMKQQQQKEKELLTLAYQSEMNALKAQIQPHFLFNTLNSISASVPSELEHTRVLIARLADTFRFALNASANEMIPLRDELAFIKAYLELEKERFHDRLTVNYNVDPETLDMEVPPMLLQPIVENSLQHGIAKSLAGGSIDIAVIRNNGSVHFEIADTGAGISEASKNRVISNGMGLQNVNQRLQKLYGTSISMLENTPSGVKVSFDIPANNQQKCQKEK